MAIIRFGLPAFVVGLFQVRFYLDVWFHTKGQGDRGTGIFISDGVREGLSAIFLLNYRYFI